MLFKKTFFIIVVLILSASLSLRAQIYIPRESAASTITQKIGITDITIEYSRPKVIKDGQDRTGKIWGGLVWYGYRKINFAGKGEIPWRAGANENTKITFSTDVKVEGQALKAGTYGLHLALAENGEETLIFSNNSTSWGSFSYNPSEDALRVNIKSQDNAFTNVLTYEFEEVGIDQGVVVLKWEKKKFPFRIETDTKSLVLTQFRTKLSKLNDPKQYLNAAAYCLNNNTNHEEAINWVDKSIEASGKNFNNLTLKGGLLYKKDDNFTVAEPFVDEAAQVANKQQLNALGYRMLQLELKEKAVEYFELNAKKNPEDPNVYDSLGEGYAAIGEKKKAIKSFKKSLSMNPPDNVKQNSIAQLKKLGVEYGG